MRCLLSQTQESIYGKVYTKIKVVHGRFVKRSQDVLGLFSLLIHFDWVSFLFISEDFYELVVNLSYLTSVSNSSRRGGNCSSVLCFRSYRILSLISLWHAQHSDEGECIFLNGNDKFVLLSKIESYIYTNILTCFCFGKKVKVTNIKSDFVSFPKKKKFENIVPRASHRDFLHPPSLFHVCAHRCQKLNVGFIIFENMHILVPKLPNPNPN